MSESLKSTVADVASKVADNAATIADTATTLENVAAKVDGLETGHRDNASRLDGFEARLSEVAQMAGQAAKGGYLGPDVQQGAGIVQEIIDFLHHVFPGDSAGIVPPGQTTAMRQQQAEDSKNAGVVNRDPRQPV